VSWLIDGLVPRIAAMVDDITLGGEEPVAEPVIAYELPNVLSRVQLAPFGW